MSTKIVQAHARAYTHRENGEQTECVWVWCIIVWHATCIKTCDVAMFLRRKWAMQCTTQHFTFSELIPPINAATYPPWLRGDKRERASGGKHLLCDIKDISWVFESNTLQSKKKYGKSIQLALKLRHTNNSSREKQNKTDNSLRKEKKMKSVKTVLTWQTLNLCARAQLMLVFGFLYSKWETLIQRCLLIYI